MVLGVGINGLLVVLNSLSIIFFLVVSDSN